MQTLVNFHTNKQKAPSVLIKRDTAKSSSSSERLLLSRKRIPNYGEEIFSAAGTLHLSRRVATTGACRSEGRGGEETRKRYARARKGERGKKKGTRRHVSSHVVSDRPCRTRERIRVKRAPRAVLSGHPALRQKILGGESRT